MLSDTDIILVPPDMALSESVREALCESYGSLIRFLFWPEPDPTFASVRSNMARAIENFENNVNEYRFFILRKSDSRLLGTIGLLIRNLKIPYLEFGYWIRSSEAGKGYVSAAVRVLEDYAVNVLKVKRLEIRMAESNVASKRVAEKAGYAFEAKLHSDRILADGSIENTLVYAKVFP